MNEEQRAAETVRLKVEAESTSRGKIVDFDAPITPDANGKAHPADRFMWVVPVAPPVRSRSQRDG